MEAYAPDDETADATTNNSPFSAAPILDSASNQVWAPDTLLTRIAFVAAPNPLSQEGLDRFVAR